MDNGDEKVDVLIFDRSVDLSQTVARKIAGVIHEKAATRDHAVLGLPTGATPLGVYRELIRLHEQEGLDFTNVITFNLDEYYPMAPSSLQSYHRFMWHNFFSKVNIKKKNVHILRGDVSRAEIEDEVVRYEREIQKSGGIDITMLGIGKDGHIAFVEPGSSFDGRTSLVVLDNVTRMDAASSFFGFENVPREALTMGIGTILDSREIILMATGEHKSQIVQRAVETPPHFQVPATVLQSHSNTCFYLDRPAAAELRREKLKWTVKPIEHWDIELTKHAMIWLCGELKKKLFELDELDVVDNRLYGLLKFYNNDVDKLVKSVYDNLSSRIRSETILENERIAVFSPHPDDDVICVGGTLQKLAKKSCNNFISVCYMTAGSIAVFDHDVERHLRWLGLLSSVPHEGIDISGNQEIQDLMSNVRSFFEKRNQGEPDIPIVSVLKDYIRRSEAMAALEILGIPASSAEFLDLPFYKTGMVDKMPISDLDIDLVLKYLLRIRPTVLFVAGDMTDPHGTHRMCYQALKAALEKYKEIIDKEEGEGKTAMPSIWLYRGAWMEYALEVVDQFVPLSRLELKKKIDSIYRHQSQKDRAAFPGAYDRREFWQRARDRNLSTAKQLADLGLPSFYAAEAFCVRDCLE